MKRFTFAKLTALFLALSMAFALLAYTPLTAEAKSKKKKETKITLQNTPGQWVQDNGIWYFTNPEGERLSGVWVAYDNAWYYLKSNGAMATNEWVQDGSSRYFIGTDSIMQENKWVSHGGSWYWLKPGGAMAANEWKQDGSAWYWLKADGKMAANTKLHIEGKNHNFDANGVWIGADLTQEQLYMAEFLRLTNLEREKYGLKPLSGDNAKLNQAAQIRAIEIVQLYEHIRPDGRGFETAYFDLGGKNKKGIGENLTIRHTPSQAIQSLMNSPGHRENMLRSNYTQLGVGLVLGSWRGTTNYYWVQFFLG